MYLSNSLWRRPENCLVILIFIARLPSESSVYVPFSHWKFFFGNWRLKKWLGVLRQGTSWWTLSTTRWNWLHIEHWSGYIVQLQSHAGVEAWGCKLLTPVTVRGFCTTLDYIVLFNIRKTLEVYKTKGVLLRVPTPFSIIIQRAQRRAVVSGGLLCRLWWKVMQYPVFSSTRLYLIGRPWRTRSAMIAPPL